MSSLESLKQAARRHEKREEWQKALDLYGQAIEKLDDQETPDIGLFNRVGDLNARIGRPEAAVEHYERAVDLYVEAELANNAIALCKKIIRNLPGRYGAYLKMGRIRAGQGFMVDARNSFLTYAEQAAAGGEVEAALEALREFAELDPRDARVILALADLSAGHGLEDEALRHLAAGRATLEADGDADGVREVEAKAREIDPDADLSTIEFRDAHVSTEAAGDHDTVELDFEPTAIADPDDVEIEADFGEISLSDDEPPAPEEFGTVDLDDTSSDGPAADLPLVTFEDDAAEDDDAFGLIEEVEAGADMDQGEDDEVLGAELPLVSFDGDVDEADDAFGTEPGEPDVSIETAFEDVAEDEIPVDVPDDPAELFDGLSEMAVQAPEDVSIPQRMVETAYRMNDESAMARAYLALGRALNATGESNKARSVFQQVLSIEPDNPEATAALEGVAGGGESRRVEEVAASEEYVDLGAMIFDDEEEEKTTRFTVAYEEPSGDEDADFKKMLSQFKAKVAENFDATDVKAHHDLGTAYKEMGLLDEAIEEFQQALRASAEHLPTYELLGQVFMEKGEPEAAVNTLKRALRKSDETEDELVGIYYFLGRAHEELGQTKEAIEFYDKVFALDINFADVTERLRTLR